MRKQIIDLWMAIKPKNLWELMLFPVTAQVYVLVSLVAVLTIAYEEWVQHLPAKIWPRR